MPSLSQDALITALRAAALAAAEWAHTEDGGTCNLDSAVFWPGRLTRSRIESAAASVQVSISTWLGRRCVFVLIGAGQGNRRTRMARAATEALKKSGLEATTYYQLD